MKIKKSQLISTYAQSIGVGAAKELITKKINAAAMEDKEDYTEEEIARICTELTNEGGIIRIVAQSFLVQLERKKSEEKTLLLDNIDTQIWYLTDVETYGAVNKARAEFLGMEKRDLEGKSIYDTVTREESQGCIVGNREVFEKKKQIHAEQWVKNGKGERRLLSITRTPKIDDNGNVEYLICVAEDITERKRAEDALKKAHNELEIRVEERTAELQAINRELEAFSYSVSHDLRAPLRAIDGFSHILLKDYVDALDEQAKHYLQRVRAATQNMGRLIDDLLNLSRIGRRPMEKKTVKVETIAREAYESLEDQWKDRKVNFTLHHCPSLLADPHLMPIVFVNLLSNALKYTRCRETAEIEIGSKTKDGEMVFYVKDNGVGFDMKYADKLFTSFQRFHRAEEYEGAGVGLAIVQRIIHRHGGRIWAESKVDVGTTFWFTLTA